MGRIAIIGENSVEYIDRLLAVWNAGDCAVLLDWRVPFRTALKMMGEANVYTCYIEKKYFDPHSVALSGIKFELFEKKDNLAAFLPEEVYERYHANYSRDEACVIYSSGTTGRAKGVILSHYAISTNADAIIDYMKPAADDRIYMLKTICHLSSITGELLVALKTHMKLLLSPIIVHPRYVFHNISTFHITKICINPTMLAMYMKEVQRNCYSLEALKEIYVQGAKANEELCERAEACFDQVAVYYEYGLSEAGPRVASQKISRRTISSVGKPIKGVEVEVVNEFGNEVLEGECGVIHVNTESRCDGYISGGMKHKSLYKGWLNTGDVGYIDSMGELHVVDRADDMMILDAHKIYPNEVESQIIHYADIEECVVVKITDSNGNDVIACLYTGEWRPPSVIRRALQSVMMSYEIPKIFCRCDALPRTLNGKVAKSKAREIVLHSMK